MNEQTLGQKRVRTSFNPNANALVDMVKAKYADIIDTLQAYRNGLAVSGPEGETPEAYQIRCGEALRTIAIAQTETENAAHWGVKAVTSQV